MGLSNRDAGELSLQERHDELWADLRQAQKQITATLRRAEKAEQERKELLSACHAAHELLFHYNVTQQPNGVDWGSVELLRSEVLATLWYAITQAQPELIIPD